MGNGKKAFNSVLYAIALLIALYAAGLFLGIMPQFGELFSLFGLVAVAFLIFSLIAE